MVDKITNPPSQKDLIDKVNELIDDKQDTLVSGTNIKTINNTSLLGSGNIDIQGGGSYTAGTGIDITNDVISVTNAISTGAALGATAVQPADLATKQDNLVSGTNIKTINNQSILGSGNLAISSRNIGEIITSTIPLTDAGLHILDGSLIQGNGIYADFVTYIAGLVSTYPDLFETEANWQTSVINYGVCGKFVYDSVNNTVRLPKITGFTEGTTDVTALGDLIQAGLPNITGGFTLDTSGGDKVLRENETSGAFSLNDASNSTAFLNTYSSGSVDTPRGRQVVFNASQSNSIYGNSTTVQPQAIKVLYYICIATSIKTEIEVDIDEIATDLNGKADVDLSNINTNGKSFVSGLGMPSSRYIDLTLGASGSTYTAPANGWFLLFMHTTTSGSLNWAQLVNWSKNDFVNRISTNISNDFSIFLPVNKGDIVGLEYVNINLSYSWNKFRFYYTEGENV